MPAMSDTNTTGSKRARATESENDQIDDSLLQDDVMRRRRTATSPIQSPVRKKVKRDNPIFAESLKPKKARKRRSKSKQSNSTATAQAELWEVEEVLEEAIITGVAQVKVKWKGIDPDTNKPWEDEWIPRTDCNQDTLDVWEEKKSKRNASLSSASGAQPTDTQASTANSASTSSATSSQQRRQRASKRPLRRIISSSRTSSDSEKPASPPTKAHGPCIVIDRLPQAELQKYRFVTASEIATSPSTTNSQSQLDPSSRRSSGVFDDSRPQSVTPEERQVLDSQEVHFAEACSQPAGHIDATDDSIVEIAHTSPLRQPDLDYITDPIIIEHDTSSPAISTPPGEPRLDDLTAPNAAKQDIRSLELEESAIQVQPSLDRAPIPAILAPVILIPELATQQSPAQIFSSPDPDSLTIATGSANTRPESQINIASTENSANTTSELGSQDQLTYETVDSAISSSLHQAPSLETQGVPVLTGTLAPRLNILRSLSQQSMSPSARSSPRPTRRSNFADIWKFPARASPVSRASTSETRTAGPSQDQPPLPDAPQVLASSTEPARSDFQAVVAPRANESAPATDEAPEELTDSAKGSSDFLPESPLELYVPVPLDSAAIDLYRSVLQTRGTQPDDAVIQQLNDVCSHPDLISTPLTQAFAVQTQLAWTLTSSSKFALLRALLSFADRTKRRISIFTKPTLLHITEAFLRGLDLTYSRPDEQRGETSSTGSLLDISLFSTGRVPESPSSTMPFIHAQVPHLVIALDETFNLEIARQRVAFGSCKVVHLVVPQSSAYYRVQKPEASVSEILELAMKHSENVGQLESTAETLGERIAFALLSDTQDVWNRLPQLRSSDADNSSGSKRKRSELSHASGSVTVGQKRPRLANESDPNSTADTSRVDESILSKGSKDVQTTSTPSQTLEAELSQLKQLHAAMESSFSDLQARFETQTKMNAGLTADLATANTALAASEQRHLRQIAAITELRAERDRLTEECKAARDLAFNPQLPHAGEMDELRRKAAAGDILKEHNNSMEKDLQFVRTQYQSLRTEVVTLKDEVNTLRAEADDLCKRASGESAKLHQTFKSTTSNVQIRNLAKVRAENAHLKRAVAVSAKEVEHLKEELEKEKERKGMGAYTRSSSLPPASLPRAAISTALKASNAFNPDGIKSGRRGPASANNSRAGSPALGGPKTSPLQRTLLME